MEARRAKRRITAIATRRRSRRSFHASSGGADPLGIQSSPSAELLSTILDRHVSEPLRRLLGDCDAADARIAMIRSILFGVIMERCLFAHEPAASVPTDTLKPVLADVLTAALTGRIPQRQVPELQAQEPPVPEAQVAPEPDPRSGRAAATRRAAARSGTVDDGRTGLSPHRGTG
ncbi:TetR/AcrR family transcriptional regulator [Streptomyces sp. NPDC055400]